MQRQPRLGVELLSLLQQMPKDDSGRLFGASAAVSAFEKVAPVRAEICL
jgi:hypothetical protein